MIRLVKGELKKITHKKSFLIVTIIFILFAILTNVLYKNMDGLNENNQEKVNIEELKEENKSLNLNNEEDLALYVENLNIIQTEEIKKDYNGKYDYLIDKYIRGLISTANENKFIAKNEAVYNDLINMKNKYLEKIEAKDWKYFANLNLDKLKNSLANAKTEVDKSRYQELINLTNYRLNNNVSYSSSDYLNNAIIRIEENIFEYYNLKNKNNLTKTEEENLKFLKEQHLRDKYILENKKDVNNNETLAAVLKNFHLEFGLFILIYVIMISGSIVSEEFNKGTIKYLLTKPYKRSTILTAKLLTILLLIPVIILFMVLIELVIGGFILGFSSVTTPVLIFDSVNEILVARNIFSYLLVMLLSIMPMYIVLGVLCFMLSTITSSSSAAITTTFLFYLLGNVISNLATIYNIKIFKVFVSLHWDFSYLVKLSTNPFNVKPSISILIVLGYIVTMLCIAYVYFNKKDVKNI